MTNATFESYEAQYEAARRLEAEIQPRNKAVLFNALEAAGIGTVVIEFEGSGDSGQMEQIIARGADGTVVQLPDQTIEIERVNHSPATQTETASLGGAVEMIAWRLLGETHGGWEDNDGGYGEFTFDVAERSIKLEFNERYIDTNYHEHEF